MRPANLLRAEGLDTLPKQLAERVIDLTGAKSKLVQRPLPADDPMQRKPIIDKAQKIEAVRQMHDGGLFIVKGAVEKAATALEVTRYTIYNYLEEIRKG